MISERKYKAQYIITLVFVLLFAACSVFSGSRYGLSEEDYNYISRETIGGKLDYSSTLDSAQIYTFNDRQYSHRQMALLMWGSSVRKIGVKNRHDAINLYEGITGAKLNAEDRKALLAGFEK